MGPGSIGLIGDAVTGLLGIGGQASANAANARQAQMNREFQERMSSTAWQRGVADMRAAGLNPALAYEKGGASSPSGSTAQMESTTAGVSSSALQASQIAAGNKLTEANARNANAQATQLELESALRFAELKARLELTRTNTARAQQDMEVGLGDYAIRRGDFNNRQRMFPADLLGKQIANTAGILNNEYLSGSLLPRIEAHTFANRLSSAQEAATRAQIGERSFRGELGDLGSRSLRYWENQFPADLISAADAAGAWRDNMGSFIKDAYRTWEDKLTRGWPRWMKRRPF